MALTPQSHNQSSVAQNEDLPTALMMIKTLQLQVTELQFQVKELEDSAPTKNKKWTAAEVNYLVTLARNINLTQDQMRTRTTLFMRLVQAHQSEYPRTERAISMRLDKEYF